VIQKLLDGRRPALQQAVEAGRLARTPRTKCSSSWKPTLRTMVEAKGISGIWAGVQAAPGGMMGQGGARSGDATAARRRLCKALHFENRCIKHLALPNRGDGRLALAGGVSAVAPLARQVDAE